MNAHRLVVRRKRRSRGSPHKGLTLFELLLALAIFLASLAALAQLLSSGSRAAAQAKLQTEAILRCEAKLGELVAGITPLDAEAGGPFEDDPRWSWQSTVTDGPWPNLQWVELRVSHDGQNALGNSTFVLRRYVRDPELFVREDVSPLTSLPRPTVGAPRRPAAPQPTNNSPGEADAEDTDQ